MCWEFMHLTTARKPHPICILVLTKQSVHMLREFQLSRAPVNASRSAVQQKVEAERAAEMSFRPRMAPHNHHNSHGPPASRAEHLEQLSRPRTALWARCKDSPPPPPPRGVPPISLALRRIAAVEALRQDPEELTCSDASEGNRKS